MSKVKCLETPIYDFHPFENNLPIRRKGDRSPPEPIIPSKSYKYIKIGILREGGKGTNFYVLLNTDVYEQVRHGRTYEKYEDALRVYFSL